MKNTREQRRQERIEKWKSTLIKNNEPDLRNTLTGKIETDIERCLLYLHELRRMTWPELNNNFRMDRSIVKIIRQIK